MPKNVPEKLEQLAGEFCIDTGDPDEPIDQLIDRIRWQIEDDRSEADGHFQDCLDQLDRIEADLPDDDEEDDESVAAKSETSAKE